MGSRVIVAARSCPAVGWAAFEDFYGYVIKSAKDCSGRSGHESSTQSYGNFGLTRACNPGGANSPKR